jgi:hypothetical protein
MKNLGVNIEEKIPSSDETLDGIIYLCGSPSRTRTYNLMVNSHPLCRLSYRGMGSWHLSLPQLHNLFIVKKVSDFVNAKISGSRKK